ncbi:MAG: carbon-nitrogen hydrolase family protein [Lachnospiraceae bacterium]|nr:carbon-nitrogen hydrolase family protein [Lachnospiraceae bacterium]
MRILQLQTPVSTDKKANLACLAAQLESFRGQKPDLVTVGEMFTCPYDTQLFAAYAEEQGGPSWQYLSDLARKHGIWLQAGSIPERDAAGRIYNTAYMFDPDGREVAHHRKMHLFDIAIEGGQHFKESDSLSAGDEVTVFDTAFGKMGLMICFDIRFVELARLMVQQGARVILVPAAFNMTTGPAHWTLNFRSRALDNQCFMVGTCTARNEKAGYVAYGHSIITSPWGDVVSEMDERAGGKITDIDITECERIRVQLPILSARREDVYRLMSYQSY